MHTSSFYDCAYPAPHRVRRIAWLIVALGILSVITAGPLLAQTTGTTSPSGISATFAGGVLTVTGDNLNNTIVASRNAAGAILVNNGTVRIRGGSPTVTNTTLIRLIGLGGDDVLTLDPTLGTLPGSLRGDFGNDVLTGTTGADELDGGPGNDALRGLGGIDRLLGGPGNDVLTGGPGDEVQLGGIGNDTFIWNPGDGSDVLEGESGFDRMLFAGSNASEIIDASANGNRLRFFRNIANIVMDCGSIERVDFRAFGGADVVTINDLTGTGVFDFDIDLDVSSTNDVADGQLDTVVVNATANDDFVRISGNASVIEVIGLPVDIRITDADPGIDVLTLNSLGGADIVDATTVQAAAMNLTLSGGVGDDALLGGQGRDLLRGNQGNDLLIGRAGDDTITWNPGDGNDVVEGQAGLDTLLFTGSAASEIMDLSANGTRLRFFRNIANVLMDCNDVETVQVNALNGADSVVVNDLTGTDVLGVRVDLANPTGSTTRDGQPDTVTVIGTNGDDVFDVSGSVATGVALSGPAVEVDILNSDATIDRLVINALAGADVVQAADLDAGVLLLTGDGGAGDDILIGSDAADTLRGSDGDDVLIGGLGTDILDGGTGDNVVIQ